LDTGGDIEIPAAFFFPAAEPTSDEINPGVLSLYNALLRLRNNISYLLANMGGGGSGEEGSGGGGTGLHGFLNTAFHTFVGTNGNFLKKTTGAASFERINYEEDIDNIPPSVRAINYNSIRLGANRISVYRYTTLLTLNPYSNGYPAGITGMVEGQCLMVLNISNYVAEIRFYEPEDRIAAKLGPWQAAMLTCHQGGSYVARALWTLETVNGSAIAPIANAIMATDSSGVQTKLYYSV
jgi:hypothetical protein